LSEKAHLPLSGLVRKYLSKVQISLKWLIADSSGQRLESWEAGKLEGSKAFEFPGFPAFQLPSLPASCH
jgi:hypothetical protein